jgi:hypothetical protein
MLSFSIGMALLLALAICAIGIHYLVNPTAATRSFGLPLPEYGANIVWWLRLKGVRDGASGLLILALMAWGASRAAGLVLLVLTLVPVGDMLLILAAKGSVRSAVGMHGTTAVLMVLTAIALLTGGR